MPLLRALGTLVTLSALVLLGAAGLSPTASAADSPSGTADIKLVIYEDETFDLSVDIAVRGYHSLAEGDVKQVGGEYTTESDEGNGGGLEGHESSFQSWYMSHYTPCNSCEKLKNPCFLGVLKFLV